MFFINSLFDQTEKNEMGGGMQHVWGEERSIYGCGGET